MIRPSQGPLEEEDTCVTPADKMFPYYHRKSKYQIGRELRATTTLMTARARPPKEVIPRKPRYMRPSTAWTDARRIAKQHGTSCGVCVTDVDAYHTAYCESLDITTAEGKTAFAQINCRYANFWTKVPAVLKALHEKRSKTHAGRSTDRNTLHRYLLTEPMPRCKEDMRADHHRVLLRLYDEMVKQSPADKGSERNISEEAADEQQGFVFCSQCQVDTIRHRFTASCPSCHRVVAIVCSQDRNAKEFEGCETASIATYKRTNHFNEWLLRTQGIEQRSVPDAVIHAVSERMRLSSRPITAQTPPKMAYVVVRQALALSQFQDYFEHVPQIMRKTTPIIPPLISAADIARIRSVFLAIQVPFERNKPRGRRNFLSYAYIIYKICELLELDEVLPFCPLFKSVQNQRSADATWLKICNELDYEYIPTV